MLPIRIVFAALLAVCLVTSPYAAEKAVPVAAAKETLPAEATYDDPLGRNTPQGTVLGFLKAMQRDDYERAVDYLDTRQTGKRAQQLAIQLNYILDQGVSATAAKLSTKPEGNLQDNLPVNQEIVGIVKTKKGEHKIRLDRIQKENNLPVWLFSSETLKYVPQIYEETDVPWIEAHLPTYLTDTRLAGQPLYRWCMPFVVLPLTFLLGWLFTKLLFALFRASLHRQLDEALFQKLRKIRKPLLLLSMAAAVYIISLGSFSLLGRLFWTFMASTLAVFGLMWLTIHLIDFGAKIIEGRRPEAANATIRLAATLLKVLAVGTGLVIIFYYFAGINLTAVVAGLGVGGIAVAFAAQKTIENFFGGVFLVWDRPIRLGDFCRAGEYQGTVEHIGLRSTQIRTVKRTVVSIPNGQLSSIGVENFSLRDRFLFQHTLNLRYETTTDQLRYLITQVREMLSQYPQVDSATVRVRFVGFGQSSLDVETFAYILDTAQESFLATQEDLLLRIMDIVESCGSGFAFPSLMVYMKKDVDIKGCESAEAMQHFKL